MNFNSIEELKEYLGEEAAELHQEFMGVAEKWFQRNPRISLMMSIQLPLNLLLHLIFKFEKDEKKHMSDLFPDLPGVFMRSIYPFKTLKDKWGKVSGEEFCKLYGEIYESQFSEEPPLE